MKSQEQIQQEIAKLVAMKPTVIKYSVFHENHHAAIDAQVHVLRELLEDDSINDIYGEGASCEDFSENIYEEAMNAWRWLYDEPSVEEAPSEGWKELVQP